MLVAKLRDLAEQSAVDQGVVLEVDLPLGDSHGEDGLELVAQKTALEGICDGVRGIGKLLCQALKTIDKSCWKVK